MSRHPVKSSLPALVATRTAPRLIKDTWYWSNISVEVWVIWDILSLVSRLAWLANKMPTSYGDWAVSGNLNPESSIFRWLVWFHLVSQLKHADSAVLKEWRAFLICLVTALWHSLTLSRLIFPFAAKEIRVGWCFQVALLHRNRHRMWFNTSSRLRPSTRPSQVIRKELQLLF